MFMCLHAIFTLIAFAIAIPGVHARCKTSADCSNNFDCIHLGFFLGSTCAPKSCAVGAVQSMIDEGFDPQKWVEDITAKSGNSGKGFWGGTSNKDAETLRRAYESADPPPIDAFTRYFEACINPKSTAGRAQPLTSTLVYNGLQWSAGAGLLYTGKNFWLPLGKAGTGQVIQTCLGYLLGAQVGVASYVARIQTWNMDIDDPSSWPFDPTNSNQDAPADTSQCDTYCVPIVALGLLQVSICWSTTRSIDSYCIVEVSVGAQLGAILGGFQACYSEYLFPYDTTQLTPSPTVTRVFPDAFSILCSTAATVEIGDTVLASLSGRVSYEPRACGAVNPPVETAGYWYRVTGDGKDITVDTCFGETNFDTQITVWTSCVDIACVAGNDDVGALPTVPCMPDNYTCSCAKASWQSTVGIEYFIFVNKYSGSADGVFKMVITSS